MVYALGLDFGTSNTVAVLRRPDRPAQPLLFDGSPLLPSAVYAEPDGRLLTGRDAVHSARLDPARFEPNPKRRIDDTTVLLGERELPVIDLIAAVISRVADEVRRTAGVLPDTVTMTCPAGWGATRRLALSDAAKRLHLPEPTLVEEPVAAAAYFARVLGREVPIGSVVVVHDLGAGTFDASVVARTSTGFEVLAVDGRNDIGGLDLDQAIIDHLGEVYAPRAPELWERLTSPSTVEDRRHRRQLWEEARAAKEQLSRQVSADLVLPLLEVDAHLTREELERLAQPVLEQTVRVTQGVMRWANLAEGRLAGVFLVGGSSRIPLMATLLHRALGEPPVVIEQPELVVAEGSLVVGSAPPIAPKAWVTGSMIAPVSPAIPAAAPAPAPAPVAVVAAPAPAPPKAKTVGRVIVPGAQPPGQAKKAAAPLAPTQQMPRYRDPAPAPVPAPRPAPPRVMAAPRPVPVQRQASSARRFFTTFFIALLLLAVPVVSAYVAYKLQTGEPLFPITVDWGKLGLGF